MRLHGLPRRNLLAVALAACCCAAAGCGNAGGPTPSAPEGDRIAKPVEALLQKHWPKGAGGTVLAARANRIVSCSGLGMADRADGVAADCDTAYDVMSMTKQFTAAAILKLEMLGELSVGDRIGEFVEDVPPDKRRITLHDLLTHTSGLPDSLGDDYDAVSKEQMLEAALESRLRSKPGTEYRYSNAGYSVLAAIVEEASALGYEEFLAGHLFGPAGMTDTGYVLPDWGPEQVAVEYDRDGRAQGRPFEHPWAADGPFWNLRGNGGMLSTARDMYRWHLALRDDTILDRAAREKMFTPHVREGPGADTHYGYGWVVSSLEGEPFMWHDGGNGWSFGLVGHLPKAAATVFWISNQAYRAGQWNLEDVAEPLTLGLSEAVRGQA